MPRVSSDAADSTVRRPYRRTKVVGGVVGVTLVVLLVLRLIWGGVAQRRLDAQLALVKGEPLTPAELFGSPDDYDDPQNAVPLLEDAAAAAMATSRAGIYSP